MKRLMATLFILALAGVASAQYETSFIGIAADEAHTICYGDIGVYVPFTTYYNVYIMDDINGVTGAEFAVGNLPPVSPNIVVIPTWYGLVIGDLGVGISIALTTPGIGPLVPLGNVQYIQFVAEIPADHQLAVIETLDSGNRIITDLDNVEIDVAGGFFTFNCSDPLHCVCVEEGTATEDASWGAVKALY